MKEPFDYVYDKIGKYLDRKYYGADHKPIARPAQDIYDNEKWIKDNYPILFRIRKKLITCSVLYEKYIIDTFLFPKRFYNNYFVDKTHTMDTGLAKGKWHDSSYKLYEGIFRQVCYFKEVEAKRDFEYYDSDDIDEDYPVHQKEFNEVVLGAYNWYKEEEPALVKEKERLEEKLYSYNKKDEEEADLLMWKSLANIGKKKTLEERELSEAIASIEKNIERKQQYHLHRIVKHIHSFWS